MSKQEKKGVALWALGQISHNNALYQEGEKLPPDLTEAEVDALLKSGVATTVEPQIDGQADLAAGQTATP